MGFWKKLKKKAKQATNWVGEKWNTGAKATTNIVQGVGDLIAAPVKGGGNKALRKLGRGLNGAFGLPFDILNDSLGRPANRIRDALRNNPPPVAVPTGDLAKGRYDKDRDVAKNYITNLHNSYKDKRQKATDATINSDPSIAARRAEIEKYKKYGTPKDVARLQDALDFQIKMFLRTDRAKYLIDKEFAKLPKLENEEYAKTLYNKGDAYVAKMQADYLKKWETQNTVDKYRQNKDYKAQSPDIKQQIEPTYLTAPMPLALTDTLQTSQTEPASSSFANFKTTTTQPVEKEPVVAAPIDIQAQKAQVAKPIAPKLGMMSKLSTFNMPQLKPKKQKAFSITPPTAQQEEEENPMIDAKNTINKSLNKFKKFTKAW